MRGAQFPPVWPVAATCGANLQVPDVAPGLVAGRRDFLVVRAAALNFASSAFVATDFN